ncbi:MAG: MFS transporter [Rhodospirillales bacterium]|nr:MFS transporter [Rhodospirillales bacterium]
MMTKRGGPGWGVVAVLLGTLTVPLDSAVNLDFPFITAHFGLPIPAIRWIVISYTLTSASLLLVFGRIADMLGHRRVFLFGTLWSAGAFVACGLAPSYAALLGGRIAQGIGAGLVMSCGPALITALYPEQSRARALGLYTLGFGLGGALGPLLGGVLATRFGWSAVFWARAPLAALGALASLALPAPPRATMRESFDAAGAALLIAATACFVLLLDRLDRPIEAGAATILALAAFLALLRRERRAAHPIIALGPFRDPGFAWANLAGVLVNLAGFAVLLLVPFALARLPALPRAAWGALLALSPAGIMAAGPLGGWLAARVAPATIMSAGGLICALGLAGVAAAPGAIGPLAVAMTIQGVGLGLFQVAYLDVLAGAIPRRERGVAGSLGMLTRTLGIVTGASLLIRLFQGLGGTDRFAAGFHGAVLFAAALAAAAGVVSALLRPRS